MAPPIGGKMPTTAAIMPDNAGQHAAERALQSYPPHPAANVKRQYTFP
jgi:hypothetical protein